MAHSKEAWEEAKFLYELDKSLTDIQSATGIDRTAISKRAKKFNWVKHKNQLLKSEIVEYEEEKSTLEVKKSTLVEKVSKLSEYEITRLDEIIESKIDRKSLIFNTQALAVIRNNQMLTKGTKTVMLKVQQFSAEGVRMGEEYVPYEVPLDSSDIKNCVEGTDKASVSLEVAERHAPRVEVNNNTGVQVNEKRVTIARRSDRA